jgi:hypothetical protein
MVGGIRLSDYADRLEAEYVTGHPALPCFHCGYDAWAVERPYRKLKSDRPCLFPAVCGHCRVIETAHHNDGGWIGRHLQSGVPGGLLAFVKEHAEYLRGMA